MAFINFDLSSVGNQLIMLSSLLLLMCVAVAIYFKGKLEDPYFKVRASRRFPMSTFNRGGIRWGYGKVLGNDKTYSYVKLDMNKLEFEFDGGIYFIRKLCVRREKGVECLYYMQGIPEPCENEAEVTEVWRQTNKDGRLEDVKIKVLKERTTITHQDIKNYIRRVWILAKAILSQRQERMQTYIIVGIVIGIISTYILYSHISGVTDTVATFVHNQSVSAIQYVKA